MEFFAVYDNEEKDAAVCNVCQNYEGLLQIIADRSVVSTNVHVASGSVFYDLLVTNAFSFFLVSENIANKLREIKAKGLELIDITVNYKNTTYQYFGLIPRGRSSSFDRTNIHEVVRIDKKGRKFIKKAGLRIDENGWDGSDVFIPDGSEACIVTDRVADAIKSFTNIYLKPVDSILVT